MLRGAGKTPARTSGAGPGANQETFMRSKLIAAVGAIAVAFLLVTNPVIADAAESRSPATRSRTTASPPRTSKTTTSRARTSRTTSSPVRTSTKRPSGWCPGPLRAGPCRRVSTRLGVPTRATWALRRTSLAVFRSASPTRARRSSPSTVRSRRSVRELGRSRHRVGCACTSATRATAASARSSRPTCWEGLSARPRTASASIFDCTGAGGCWSYGAWAVQAGNASDVGPRPSGARRALALAADRHAAPHG